MANAIGLVGVVELSIGRMTDADNADIDRTIPVDTEVAKYVRTVVIDEEKVT